MLVKRSIPAVVVIALFVAPYAKGDAFVTGAKFALEKSVGKLAEMGYKTNCKAKNLDYKSDDSWYCGMFASLSGQDKAEYEERVMHNLGEIRKDLAGIKTAVDAIQDRQQDLLEKNQQILLRLDEIGPETAIGRDLAQLRTIYKEQYAPLFDGEHTFTPQRMRAFAHRIVFDDKLHHLLGVINDQLTTPQIAGREPLLRAYAKREAEQVRAAKATTLQPSYLYLESIVDGLLADQRKGYLMYIWATETLQSDCEMAQKEPGADVEKRCKDFRTFPHTADEYRKTFQDHVRAQLGELNAGIEYMVLAASDTHARRADFLMPEAERLFGRADFFTAGQLGEGFGIRGRVISMGNGFNGKLATDRGEWSPADSHKVSANGRTDWWKSTAGNLTFDQLHFDDRWVIYHYHVKQAGAGTVSITTSLPHAPKVTVETVDADGTMVPFGSFTAIARAGGGYALLSGRWKHRKETPRGEVVGALSNGLDDSVFDAEKLRAGLRYGGELTWEAKNFGQDQHIKVLRDSFAFSDKSIRYPDGGEVTLHADLADTYPVTCPGGACADFEHNEVLYRFLDFSKPLISGRSAKMDIRSELLIDTDVTGSNGLVWKREGTTDSKFEDRNTATRETARIRLDATPRQVMFGGYLMMDAQTSTTSPTRWRAHALVFLDNAYITP